MGTTQSGNTQSNIGRKQLTVVGLGPGNPDYLPLVNLDALRNARALLLRTRIHPMAEWLTELKIPFSTCDDLYECANDFESLYTAIANKVLECADVYAVPGHPMVGEESVKILAEQANLQVLPAPSFIDAVLAEIRIPISGPLQIWNAHASNLWRCDHRVSQLIYQVDSIESASDAKLTLLRFFPPDHPVCVVSNALTKDAKIENRKLSELDHGEFSPLTSVWVQGVKTERQQGFYGLVEIVDQLLGPKGCPWDKEQTHHSLKRYLIEETYETIEAIDANDSEKLCEELGDLLLQPIMHAQMESRDEGFDIDDVITAISEKLVRRHPHVFGDKELNTAEEVLKNWDVIKQKERSDEIASVMAGVPQSLPSLLRAFEVSKRASRIGFEWSCIEDVFLKLKEEEKELIHAIAVNDKVRIEDELGDYLFTIVNIARWLDVDPEDALRKMINRFISRFICMEKLTEKSLNNLTIEEWDALWVRAKESH